jgi:hypothetical protein
MQQAVHLPCLPWPNPMAVRGGLISGGEISFHPRQPANATRCTRLFFPGQGRPTLPFLSPMTMPLPSPRSSDAATIAAACSALSTCACAMRSRATASVVCPAPT